MKRPLFIWLLLGVSLALFAQKGTYLKGFEINGSASLGVNALSYLNTGGNRADGPGMGLGIGVAFFKNEHWGLSTGLNFTNYTSFASFANNYTFTNYTVDSDGQPCNVNFKLNNTKEVDVAYQMSIPLMVNYRYYLPTGNALFAAGGLKVSFPLGSTYRVTSGNVTTTGYYPDLNATISNIPELGFTSNDIKGLHGTTSFKSTYMASFEIGYLLRRQKNSFLTFSLYGDLGLNNLRRTYTSTPLMYNYYLYGGLPGSDLVNQVKLYSVGIKISWNIHLSGGGELPTLHEKK
ncbi:outer membrane beta-barrel protein [Microbacter margulisiae]|uniref:Outer membrane protein beta-barrel domain-containing protein n=1 Tax=Microbacter margulisiae TaxID=1350067 RepID=A0A7W5DPJ1_9PORP|nr:outer membrane beta-barrel protein [Microbacter margulisiae]MBB3186420.1 hypothetical protein [Microbacter margulisiae]